MQFPRYEFVIPCEHERCPTARRPRPRPLVAQRAIRPQGRFQALRRLTSRREPRPELAIHEYLELEFTVEERR